MRILFITNDLAGTDGWSTVGAHIVEGLRSHHLVCVLEGSQIGAPFTSLSRSMIWGVMHRKSILRRIEHQQFDIVICNIEPLLPVARMLKKAVNARKLILIGHGTYAWKPFVRSPFSVISKHIARCVNAIVVPSAFTSQKVAEWWHGPVKVIPWGVDTNRYFPLQREKECALISVGEAKARKGISTLLEAVAIVSKQFPSVNLILVGKINADTMSLIAEFNLSSHVRLSGRVGHEQLLELMSRAVIHVLPSVNTPESFEGFGLVHLEANACGLPSIGSLGTANEEVIIDGVTGYLVRQNDPHNLAEKILTLLRDSQMSSKMSMAALEHARRKSWNSTIQRFDELLAELQ